MSERSVKYNTEEAAALFARGVGAAKGGQKRVAASLLSRAVQLDPTHEQAWLWLSGVLEDPNEIAFCLRSVLSINPSSERARQGLAWLEQRKMVAAQPVPAAIPAAQPQQSERDRSDREHRENWWVGWRRNRRETSRAWQIVLVAMIMLYALTIGLNYQLRQIISQSKAQHIPTAAPDMPQATLAPTAIPLYQKSLAASEDAQALAYLSAFEAQRGDLRAAVEAYREATSKLGNSSLLHASAARTLREKVDGSYKAIAALSPPASLREAHAAYLKGLDEERAAMDDMLEFYGSFSVQLVNRAVLRLEDASQQIAQARAMFGRASQRANTSFPAYTIR